jgi:hypothetical protein
MRLLGYKVHWYWRPEEAAGGVSSWVEVPWLFCILLIVVAFFPSLDKVTLLDKARIT